MAARSSRWSKRFMAALGVSHVANSSAVILGFSSAIFPAPFGLRLEWGKRVGVARLSDGRPIPLAAMIVGITSARKRGRNGGDSQNREGQEDSQGSGKARASVPSALKNRKGVVGAVGRETSVEEAAIKVAGRADTGIGYLIVLASAALIAIAPFILAYQCLLWLRLGVWPPYTPQDLFAWLGVGYPHTDWAGIQKIIDGFMNWPLVLAMFVIGWPGAYFGWAILREARRDR